MQPVAEASVELLAAEAPDADGSVGGVVMGDGFEKFCRGELQIADPSRPIEKHELEACAAEDITPVELQVGIDGLSVAAHEDLAIPDDFIPGANLKKLLDPKSAITNPQAARRRRSRPEGLLLHAGYGVGHVRLLHRGGPRDRRRAAHERRRRSSSSARSRSGDAGVKIL